MRDLLAANFLWCLIAAHRLVCDFDNEGKMNLTLFSKAVYLFK